MILNRRVLQQSLFLIWLIAFGSSTACAGIKFYRINDDYQNFLMVSNVKYCRQNDANEPRSKACQDYADKTGINVFTPQWQSDLVSKLFENISKIYLPILAIMLTTFLTTSTNFKSQLVKADQYIIAVTTFGVIQIITFYVIYIYIFDSGPILDANIPNMLATAFSVIMGIVVGFSFPETGTANEVAPTNTQSPPTADGR